MLVFNGDYSSGSPTAVANAVANKRQWEMLIRISPTPFDSHTSLASPPSRIKGWPPGWLSISISVHRNRRQPVPRLFITASLPAKRAASLSEGALEAGVDDVPGDLLGLVHVVDPGADLLLGEVPDEMTEAALLLGEVAA